MRISLGLLAALLGCFAPASSQTCTGLCLQQVSCPGGGTTSISGIVYAPNGVDPLPNVLVYIPNAPVASFTPGVACPVVGQAPSGSPLVGTTTAVDGSFTIANVPVGANIPLVITSGRWRRQVVIPTTSACADTPFSTRFPKNQSEGDIPKFAIATGSADAVECVLRKVGIDDAEFTNPAGTGRINLYLADDSPGAVIDATTPSGTTLTGDLTNLNTYDVLMLPCEGGEHKKSSPELANVVAYANAGGRVYSSHYSYVWEFENPPFDKVAHWDVSQKALNDGPATVDTTFAEGQTLAKWLQVVGASTTPGQINVSTTRHDVDGVIAPTQSYLTLNDVVHNNPVMQFVFDTPVGATGQQCGRVLVNEYHVENPNGKTSGGYTFPAECPTTATMTPQEKLLEFSLFELTNDGGQATLIPTSQDFGTQAVNFATNPKTFTFTNNSTFATQVSTAAVSRDFIITSNGCGNLAAGASCTLNVAFDPTAVGARTGTLTVGTSSQTLTSVLTGNGIPDIAVSLPNLTFGNLDVGATATQSFTVTNNAPGPVAIPSLALTGDYTAATTCGSTLAPLSICTVAVTFKPSTTGPRPGSFAFASSDAAYTGTPGTMTGNGVDFTLTETPGSGSVIAGYKTSLTTTTTPIAGFSAPVTMTCITLAPGSTCSVTPASFTPSATTTSTVVISTTSQYTVVGYTGGPGGNRYLILIALASGALLLLARRRTLSTLGPDSGLSNCSLLRTTLTLLFIASAGLALTGCSGQLPGLNATPTTPGNYTYTLTATDGFLTRSTTYTLTVTGK